MPGPVIFLNRFFAPDHSATSQLLTDLAYELADRGVPVTVITSRQRYDDAQAELPARETIRGVRVHRVWTTRFGRTGLVGRAVDYLSFYVSATLQLFCLARRGSTVVAMTDPPLISIPALAVAKLKGLRLVNWLQDVFPEVAERLGVITQPWLLGLLRRLRNASLRGAAVNVVIGERMAALVKQEAGHDAVVIPNWALEEGNGDIHHFRPDGHGAGASAPSAGNDECPHFRSDWNLGDAFVVGYSGNMGRAHRLDVLVDAAALLRDVPGVVFLLVGDGAQRPALEARVRSMGLANVRFQPYQPRERLRASLSVPDIHVVSLDARMEGLIVPSKFVGVIALGKPVLWLGDADGEIGALVRGTVCGVVAGVEDAVGIAAAVRELAGQRERVAAMSAAAAGLWRERFTRRAALEAWARMV